MTHLAPAWLHGYKNRAIDVRVDVSTTSDQADFSAISFRVASVNKTGLSAVNGGSGVTIDFTLTAADMNSLAEGTHTWECVATLGGEQRTIARGLLAVDAELTTSP